MAADDDAICPVVAVKVINESNGMEKTTYALIDTASNKDCISPSLVSDLNLPFVNRIVELQTMATNARLSRDLANYRIEMLDGSYGASIVEGFVGCIYGNNLPLPNETRQTTPMQKE